MPQFNASLVENYDRDLGGLEHPILSRASGTVLADGSMVAMASIGPRYQGGIPSSTPSYSTALPMPRNGSILGPPTGEPLAWLDEQRRKKKKIRSDGGSIIQLADGSLRMYSQCYGVRLSVAEAENIHGPWVLSKTMKENHAMW